MIRTPRDGMDRSSAEHGPRRGRPRTRRRGSTASNGSGVGLIVLLSCASTPDRPTKKLSPSATWRLNTGWTFSSTTDFTAAVPPEGAEDIARLEVADHGPALAGLPEAMDAGGDDRLAIQFDAEGRIGWVVVDRDQRLVLQLAGPGVLGEDIVAGAEVFDGTSSVHRLHRASPRRSKNGGRDPQRSVMVDRTIGSGLGLIGQRDLLDDRGLSVDGLLRRYRR